MAFNSYVLLDTDAPLFIFYIHAPAHAFLGYDDDTSLTSVRRLIITFAYIYMYICFEIPPTPVWLASDVHSLFLYEGYFFDGLEG
jgi:hypothetical protein